MHPSATATPPWTIRRATAGDVPALVALRRALFESMGYTDACLLDRVAQASARYLAAALPAGEFLAWVAEAGGRVLASGGMVIHAIPPTPQALTGREGYIMNFYTLPEWRRRGIARAIMRAILEHLRAEGVSLASLHATEMGRPLYGELGFGPTNELRLVLEPHPPAERNNR